MGKTQLLVQTFHDFSHELSASVQMADGTETLKITSSKIAVATTSAVFDACLLYTSPSPRDRTRSRMPSSA